MGKCKPGLRLQQGQAPQEWQDNQRILLFVQQIGPQWYTAHDYQLSPHEVCHEIVQIPHEDHVVTPKMNRMPTMLISFFFRI